MLSSDCPADNRPYVQNILAIVHNYASKPEQKSPSIQDGGALTMRYIEFRHNPYVAFRVTATNTSPVGLAEFIQCVDMFAGDVPMVSKLNLYVPTDDIPSGVNIYTSLIGIYGDPRLVRFNKPAP